MRLTPCRVFCVLNAIALGLLGPRDAGWPFGILAMLSIGALMLDLVQADPAFGR